MSSAREVAAACGVSLSTVNKILRYPEAPFRVSTREKVLAAARRLGYRPNASAAAVRTGRFDAVLLLQDARSSRSGLNPAFHRAVTRELERHGIHLVYMQLDDDQLESPEGLKLFRQTMADGIILDYHSVIPPPLKRRLDELQLPWILINHRAARDCVFPDEVAAGRLATEHLIKQGHQRIDYLDIHFRDDRAGRFHFSRRDRLQGYLEAMHAAGLTPRAITATQRPFARPATDPAFYRDLLAARDRATACVLNTGLREILRAALLDLSLAIPDDLSLVAIDPPELPLVCDITRVTVPWQTIGATAVELLRRRIAGDVKHTRPRVLPPVFVAGTTAAPRNP